MSAKEQFDPAILATLTDEERAAIAGDDADIHDLDALKKLADATAAEDGAVANDDDDDDADDDDPPPTDDAATLPPKDVQPAVPSQADAAAPIITAPQPSKVVYDYRLPGDYAEKVAAIRDREDDLAQQFKSGDLDFDAYRAATRELDLERDGLADMRVKAAISEELTSQTSEQTWNSALISFNATVASKDGIDYAKDAEKSGDFDLFLKTLGEKADNADKDMNWFIAEAHKRVKALHGIADRKPADPAPVGKPNRAPPLSTIPQTLNGIPGSDGPGDVSDEFSAIDRLDGLAFEDALASLKRSNPSAFARYEAR